MAQNVKNLLNHSVFESAVADLHTIGVTVSAEPLLDARCYAVVGGRSNARWWLLPLNNGRVTASGFALFQPLLVSARIMKLVVCVLSLLGMSRLWSKNKLYLSGESTLDSYFPNIAGPAYAYFTGTDSPHRKVAVQVMDSKGRIKGFAKLGGILQVVSLLQNETVMLETVKALQLKAAHIPQVLYSGPMGDGYCLLTDTLKTPVTSSVTKFGQAHRAFLRELAAATAQPPSTAAAVAAEFERRIEHQERQLDSIWRTRLQRAVNILAEQNQLAIPQCMSHGDFTPSNTFMVDVRLYVFDWEYSEMGASAGNDILHFVLSQPQLRSASTAKKIVAASRVLSESWTGFEPNLVSPLFLIYILTQVLRQIDRLTDDEFNGAGWDGAVGQAEILDLLVLGGVDSLA